MPDSRGTIKIDISSIKEWYRSHYNIYAKDQVKIDGVPMALVCSCSMGGNFIVSLGNDIIYSGDSMVEAMNTFNLNVRRLYDLWINIKKESKNRVINPSTQNTNP